MDEAAELTARLTKVRLGVCTSMGPGFKSGQEQVLRDRLGELGRTDLRSSMEIAELAGVASVVAYYLGHAVTNRVLEPVERTMVEAEGNPGRLHYLLKAIPGIAAEKLRHMEELAVSLLKVKGGNHD